MQKVKDVLSALFSLGEAVSEAKQNDGKFTLADLGLVVLPATKVPQAIESSDGALAEWANATQAQRDELIAWLKQDFDIADDKAEARIEAGLSMLVQAGIFFAA